MGWPRIAQAAGQLTLKRRHLVDFSGHQRTGLRLTDISRQSPTHVYKDMSAAAHDRAAMLVGSAGLSERVIRHGRGSSTQLAQPSLSNRGAPEELASQRLTKER